MTWFRVGGAGIPASLKNAMNAVFNKKFGTSGQNYPPNGWPDDVNLLGPLPEKTVAGAIAHTDDAADTVPVKSVICSIVPKQAGTGTPSPTNPRAISGYTGLTISQIKKNIYKTKAAGRTNADVTYTVNSDGSISLSGLSTGTSYFSANTGANVDYMSHYPAGTYTLSGGISNNIRLYAVCYDDDGNALSNNFSNANGQPKSETINQSFWFRIQIVVLSGIDTTGITINPQLEVGSSASQFEALTKVSEISDSWSSVGTIYGGERNLSNGTLTQTYARKVIDGTETSGDYLAGTNNNGNRVGFALSDAEAPKYSGCFSNVLENKACLNSATWTIGAFCVYGGKLYIVCPNEYTSYSACINYLISINAEIVYPLATPIEYTNLQTYDFETLYAVNNFYSDIEDGQTQVTYRQDIALALQALQGSRSLSASLMRSGGPDLEERSEDPEEVSELEENIQNTEEQEGENDER